MFNVLKQEEYSDNERIWTLAVEVGVSTSSGFCVSIRLVGKPTSFGSR